MKAQFLFLFNFQTVLIHLKKVFPYSHPCNFGKEGYFHISYLALDYCDHIKQQIHHLKSHQLGLVIQEYL